MDARSPRCDSRGLRWVGDPVDVVTGVMADTAAEFALPSLGPSSPPIAWRRSYSTQPLLPGPLGWGHTHEYEHTLRVVVDGWLYTRPDGESLLLPFSSESTGAESAHHVLRATPSAITLHLPDGTTLEFAPPTGTLARLRKLSHETGTLVLERDPRGRLTRLADADGARVLAFEHDREFVRTIWLTRHPARPEQPPLALMRYRYSDAGDLVAAIDRYGHTQRFTYDADHRMLTRVDRSGYRFEYTYDSSGRCIVSRGHDGNGEVRLRYMPEAQATEVTRADGGAWLYQYDASLSITAITDPYGGVRRFEYDDDGRLTRETDPSGNTRTAEYDESGELVAWHAEAGSQPTTNPSGPPPHPVPRTPAELELGSLAAALVADAPFASPGIAPLFSSGASIYSRLFPEQDPRENTACHRDELGVLISERGPAPTPRRWAYTPNGWVRLYIDHDGGRYEFSFAGGNLRTSARDPLGRTIRYEYTHTDQIAAVTDPAGNRHTYRYDLRDALTEVHHAGRLVESYEHDRAGNHIATRDADGALRIAYEYTPGDSQPSRRRLADGEEHRYTYTPDGRFARIEWRDHALEFAYTEAGRRRLDLRDGRGVEHTFRDEQLRSTTVLGRFTTSYRRLDPQTLEITDPLGNRHRLVLERDGVVTRHLACGAREIAQFDRRGRVREKHLLPANPADEPWRRHFTYSAESDLLTVADSQRGTTHYRYDAAHQLAAVVHPEGHEDRYAYDEAANLVEAPHLPTVSIAPGNQLFMARGASFTYDHRNHLAVWEREDRTLRFHRDALGRLRAIDGLAVGPWTADYDPLGRRTRKTFGDTSVETFWDTDRLAAELHSSGRVRIYIYLDDLSLTPWLFIDYPSLDADPASGTLHYLLTDQRGAPVAALDATGERVWSAKLAPYGLAELDGSLDIPLRLPGQLHDPETGLCYNRFRYYSPELARYLEEDPAGTGGGLNLYAYTHCPLVQFDPRGLAVCTECEAGTCTREDHARKKSPRPAADAPPRPKDPPYPSDWKKFNPAHHEAFKKRLHEFRRNDDLKYNHHGGEGRIFRSGESKVALKRWYKSRLGDMKRSLERLENARNDVEAHPRLSQDIEVVKIYEKGPDWILRDFDPDSVELRDGDEKAWEVRDRALSTLRDLKSKKCLTKDLEDVLDKLKSDPPSANLHWSEARGKILVIDMQ